MNDLLRTRKQRRAGRHIRIYPRGYGQSRVLWNSYTPLCTPTLHPRQQCLRIFSLDTARIVNWMNTHLKARNFAIGKRCNRRFAGNSQKRLGYVRGQLGLRPFINSLTLQCRLMTWSAKLNISVCRIDWTYHKWSTMHIVVQRDVYLWQSPLSKQNWWY